MDFAPGKELANGRYVILRRINQGGTSTVFEAVDRQSVGHPSVALKVDCSTRSSIFGRPCVYQKYCFR